MIPCFREVIIITLSYTELPRTDDPRQLFTLDLTIDGAVTTVAISPGLDLWESVVSLTVPAGTSLPVVVCARFC